MKADWSSFAVCMAAVAIAGMAILLDSDFLRLVGMNAAVGFGMMLAYRPNEDEQ